MHGGLKISAAIWTR